MSDQPSNSGNGDDFDDDDLNFLQSLVSEHTIAAGMLESALKNLKTHGVLDMTVFSRLEKSVSALRRMELILVKRRKASSGSEGGSQAA